MAMSHADCDHPRTPAGRAACRRAGGPTPDDRSSAEKRFGMPPEKPVAAPTWTVVPRGRTPRRSSASVALKRPGTHLRTIGDLPDVPRMLAHGCRIAWDRGWDVVVGHEFTHDEKRIVINGAVAEVALVWKPSLPEGVWGVFVRKHRTSITHRIDAGIDHAMRIADGSVPFPG